MTLAKNWLAMVWNDARPRSAAPVYVLPRFAMVTALAVFLAGLAQPAAAERIANTTAVFAALDKVTARISKLEIGLGLTQKFGALKVTPRVCFSRPATERPKTTAFVEIDEINLDGSTKRILMRCQPPRR